MQYISVFIWQWKFVVSAAQKRARFSTEYPFRLPLIFYLRLFQVLSSTMLQEKAIGLMDRGFGSFLGLIIFSSLAWSRWRIFYRNCFHFCVNLSLLKEWSGFTCCLRPLIWLRSWGLLSCQNCLFDCRLICSCSGVMFCFLHCCIDCFSSQTLHSACHLT